MTTPPDEPFLGKIDELFKQAVNILREDKILAHIKGSTPPKLSGDPALPPLPAPADVPPSPQPKHWFLGTIDE